MTPAQHSNPASTNSACPSFLASLNERLSLALESAGQIAFEWTLLDDQLYFSGEATVRLRGVLGNTREAWRGRRLLDLVHPGDKSKLVSHLRQALHGLEEKSYLGNLEVRLGNKKLGWYWVSISGKVVEHLASSCPSKVVIGTISDIHQRKSAELLQLAQSHVLGMIATRVKLDKILATIARILEDQSSAAVCSFNIWDTSTSTIIRHVAPSLPPVLQELATRVADKARTKLLSNVQDDGELPVIESLQLNVVSCREKEALNKYKFFQAATWLLGEQHGDPTGVVTLLYQNNNNVEDTAVIKVCRHLASIAITSHASEERIRQLAHYDGLTGLANRFLFQDHLRHALQRAERERTRFAVFFLDLDQFKEINDSFGHDVGDQVLLEVANRLRSTLRHTDKIARMGGDEFYVLVEGLKSSRYAAEVARKLLDAVSKPIALGGRLHQVSVSIGIGIYPYDGKDAGTLIKNADAAMYRAKQRGKNDFAFFNAQAYQQSASVLPFIAKPRTRLEVASSHN